MKTKLGQQGTFSSSVTLKSQRQMPFLFCLKKLKIKKERNYLQTQTHQHLYELYSIEPRISIHV